MPANKYPGNCRTCGTLVVAAAGNLVLTDKGWRIECLTRCEPAPRGRAADAGAVVGEMSGILALFDRAKKHLKFPKIVLSFPWMGPECAVRLNIATERAKVRDSITIVDANRNPETGERAWLGRIRFDGRFEPSAHCMACFAAPELAERLKAFAADPVGIASEHGRLTGKCCFCNQTLDDERSTSVGYGPVCARNFGLPWGSRPAEFAGGPRNRSSQRPSRRCAMQFEWTEADEIAEGIPGYLIAAVRDLDSARGVAVEMGVMPENPVVVDNVAAAILRRVRRDGRRL